MNVSRVESVVRRLVDRLDRFFATGLAWKLPLLVLIFLGHTVAQGLQMDDWFHRISLRGDPAWRPIHGPWWRLFVFFDGDPTRGGWARAHGVVPWWSDIHGRIAFFRPLSSLTHALDYALAPDAPWCMHVHSLAWYALALVAVATLLRRVLPSRTAAVATAIYLFDPAHAAVAAWIANRNALTACAFGVLALTQHDLAAREDNRRARLLGPLFFALALASGESAVGALGYLVAHALTLDARPWKARALDLAPYLALTAAWSIAYRLGGYGVRGSAMYLDPGGDPLRFALEVPRNALLLIASVWGYGAPEVAVVAPAALPVLVALGAVSVAVMLWALQSRLRADPAVRYLALASALSVLPSCATMPSGRLLLIPGVALSGVLAVALVQVAEDLPARGVRRVAALWAGVGVALGRMLLGALLTAPMAWQIVGLDGAFLRCAQSVDAHDAALSGQRAVIVNAPDAAFAGYFMVHRQQRGWTSPDAVLALAVGTRAVHLRRIDDDTIEVRSEQGFYRGITDGLLRDRRASIPVGTHISLDEVQVEITHALPDGMPDTARFHFAQGAASARYRWLTWDGKRYLPFALPAVGAEATLAAHVLSL